MTTVTYRQGMFMRELVAEGHAGAAPAGEDLVCAAVSMLMQTLEARARAVPAYFAEVTKDGEKALYRVRCLPDTSEDRRCREMFETVKAGFRLLAEQEPDHVTYREL